MEISDINFNVLRNNSFRKFVQPDCLNETMLLLIYQYVNIVKKIKNLNPVFLEDNVITTSDQSNTGMGKVCMKVDSLCESLWDYPDIDALNRKNSPTNVDNLQKELTTTIKEKMISKMKITELEEEIARLNLKMEERINNPFVKEKDILRHENDSYDYHVKKRACKNARKLGCNDLNPKEDINRTIIIKLNSLFKKAKKQADINIMKLNSSTTLIKQKNDIIKSYEDMLKDLPNNQIYIAYEKQKIEEVKNEVIEIIQEKERIMEEYVNNVREKFIKIHNEFLRYNSYMVEKEERLRRLHDVICGDNKTLTEILKMSDQKLLGFTEKIKQLKEERRYAFIATEKMERKYYEMREELSQEYPYYMDRIKKLDKGNRMRDYYKYIKYKKYNNNYNNKIISKHLKCDCCVKIDQEKIAGYCITPSVLDLLQKRGLEKIILFDIKNCSNEMEKLILKGLIVLKKKYGGKSSIWYRHFISDKYYRYDKKNVDDRFYYTFLSKEVCDINILYDEFKNDLNKKLTYNSYYSTLDREANLKISSRMLSKEEIKMKNKKKNDFLKKTTEDYLKMYFYKGFKKTSKNKVKEKIKEKLYYRGLYSKNKHLKTKKSHLEKKIVREGYIRKEDILDFIKKEESKGSFIPIIERVDYDIQLYEKTMEKIMTMVNDMPDLMDLTEEGVRMIIGNYKNRVETEAYPSVAKIWIGDYDDD